MVVRKSKHNQRVEKNKYNRKKNEIRYYGKWQGNRKKRKNRIQKSIHTSRRKQNKIEEREKKTSHLVEVVVGAMAICRRLSCKQGLVTKCDPTKEKCKHRC